MLTALRSRWLGGSRPMHASIVRRSLFVSVFIGVGHGFYFLLILLANVALDAEGFGRFYTAWALLNVMIAPGSIIVTLLSGYFADTFRAGGAAAVPTALAHAAFVLLPWFAGAVLLLEVVFFIGGNAIGVDSIGLMILLPLTAGVFLAVEVTRAVFQGMLRFTWFGVSWVGLCATQCALGVGGLALIGTPWAGFAG